jgi:hypothetical protein
VRRFAPLIQAGEVLDLACGAGRHARHLAFLLEPGELIERAAGAGLSVVAYEDGRVGLQQAAMLQRLCAAGPAFERHAALLSAF